jgi:hypothetical protein
VLYTHHGYFNQEALFASRTLAGKFNVSPWFEMLRDVAFVNVKGALQIMSKLVLDCEQCISSM